MANTRSLPSETIYNWLKQDRVDSDEERGSGPEHHGAAAGLIASATAW